MRWHHSWPQHPQSPPALGSTPQPLFSFYPTPCTVPAREGFNPPNWFSHGCPPAQLISPTLSWGIHALQPLEPIQAQLQGNSKRSFLGLGSFPPLPIAHPNSCAPQDALSSKGFGTDLPLVNSQVEEHNIFHNEVMAIGPHIVKEGSKVSSPAPLPAALQGQPCPEPWMKGRVSLSHCPGGYSRFGWVPRSPPSLRAQHCMLALALQ